MIDQQLAVKKWNLHYLHLSSSVSLQAEQLRQHYMTKYDSEVADARQALQPVLQNIKELKRKVRNVFASASTQICFDKTTDRHD